MPVDTQRKRFAMMNLGEIAIPVIPPDGTTDNADRSILNGEYIYATEVIITGFGDEVYLYRQSTVVPLPASNTEPVMVRGSTVIPLRPIGE